MQQFTTLIISLSLLMGCKEAPKLTTFDRPVRVYKIKELGAVDKSFAGVVSSAQTTTLAFKMGGDINFLDVSEGSRVTRGEKVASVSPLTLDAQYNRDYARFQSAKADLERKKQLLKINAISQQQYESSYSLYVSAKSALATSSDDLESTTLYAPFSGVVEELYAQNYQRVQMAQQVMKIVNPDSIEVNFTVSPSDAAIFIYGNVDYFIKFDTYPQRVFKARLVRFVDLSIGSEGFPVVLEPDDPSFSASKLGIRPGSTCSAILEIKNPEENNVVAIPISAIYASQSSGDSLVWLYMPNSQSVELRKVKFGELLDSDMIVVKEGLELGDLVVSAGVYMIKEGEKVKLEL